MFRENGTWSYVHVLGRMGPLQELVPKDASIPTHGSPRSAEWDSCANNGRESPYRHALPDCWVSGATHHQGAGARRKELTEESILATR